MRFNGFNLSEKSTKILMLLFFYRGMPAKNLTTFTASTLNYTLSDEKSTYNILSNLKKLGLVESRKLQKTESLGSMYYLTKDGLELIKTILDIDAGQNGEGWLSPKSETTFWDIPYESYLPPLKQPSHHLLNIEFLNRLYTEGNNKFEHRTNLYASKSYQLEGKRYRLRPDSEIKINDKLYAIEIDRATESHEQLILKFEAYKHYFDYCQKADAEKEKFIDNIVFVIESKTRQQGMKRRWKNIYNAFLKVFGISEDTRLILTSIDKVSETLMFEKNRQLIEDKQLRTFISKMDSLSYSYVKSIKTSNFNEHLYSIFHDKEKNITRVIFFASTHKFSSDMLSKYYSFKNIMETKTKKSAGVPEDSTSVLVSKFAINSFEEQNEENMDHYNLDQKIVNIYIEMIKNLNTLN